MVLLNGIFFFFRTLSVLSHSLLICKVSAEKSTDSIMEIFYRLHKNLLMLLLKFSLSFTFDGLIDYSVP
jgi:hypothetical protein